MSVGVVGSASGIELGSLLSKNVVPSRYRYIIVLGGTRFVITGHLLGGRSAYRRHSSLDGDGDQAACLGWTGFSVLIP